VSISLQTIRIEELVALRRNPQYLTEKQQRALEQSIEQDGFLCPIVVRRKSKKFEILSGNHRVLASRSVGLAEIPCVLLEPCTDEQAARIAVNMNSVHGDPNVELLAPFLAEMTDEVLASVFIEDDMLSELRDFDDALKLRLDSLEVPDAFDSDSPKGKTPNCVCKCGHRHVRVRESSKSSPRRSTAASKSS
jgi:ParB-like chromosome segregation protein Spo0J